MTSAGGARPGLTSPGGVAPEEAITTAAEGSGRDRCAQRRFGLILVIVGSLSAAVALAGVARDGTPHARQGEPEARLPHLADAGPVPDERAKEVTVETTVYDPGQRSGWHRHEGIHVVAVVSGTLTVYDKACEARSYGAGDVYIGGHDVHETRNEQAAPAHLVITYVLDRRASAEKGTIGLPAPSGCPGH